MLVGHIEKVGPRTFGRGPKVGPSGVTLRGIIGCSLKGDSRVGP